MGNTLSIIEVKTPVNMNKEYLHFPVSRVTVNDVVTKKKRNVWVYGYDGDGLFKESQKIDAEEFKSICINQRKKVVIGLLIIRDSKNSFGQTVIGSTSKIKQGSSLDGNLGLLMGSAIGEVRMSGVYASDICDGELTPLCLKVQEGINGQIENTMFWEDSRGKIQDYKFITDIRDVASVNNTDCGAWSHNGYLSALKYVITEFNQHDISPDSLTVVQVGSKLISATVII